MKTKNERTHDNTWCKTNERKTYKRSREKHKTHHKQHKYTIQTTNIQYILFYQRFSLYFTLFRLKIIFAALLFWRLWPIWQIFSVHICQNVAFAQCRRFHDDFVPKSRCAFETSVSVSQSMWRIAFFYIDFETNVSRETMISRNHRFGPFSPKWNHREEYGRNNYIVW